MEISDIWNQSSVIWKDLSPGRHLPLFTCEPVTCFLLGSFFQVVMVVAFVFSFAWVVYSMFLIWSQRHFAFSDHLSSDRPDCPCVRVGGSEGHLLWCEVLTALTVSGGRSLAPLTLVGRVLTGCELSCTEMFWLDFVWAVTDLALSLSSWDAPVWGPGQVAKSCYSLLGFLPSQLAPEILIPGKDFWYALNLMYIGNWVVW